MFRGQLPPAFTMGFSRLASSPPQAHIEPPLPSAWLDDVMDDLATLPASPILHAARSPLFPPAVVPESWEDATGDVAEDEARQVLGDPVAEERTPSPDNNLFVRPQAPLLPCPAPALLTPTLPKVQPTSITRRSARLINKPKMHAMDKAVHVLNTKMGVASEGVPLLDARKAYVDKFSTTLPDKAVEALAKLFKLNIRSMTEADESLIAMGGPGGCELDAQDVTV